ncbi:MAG: VWA domain-containing protein [Polyangiales bacterium]
MRTTTLGLLSLVGLVACGNNNGTSNPKSSGASDSAAAGSSGSGSSSSGSSSGSTSFVGGSPSGGSAPTAGASGAMGGGSSGGTAVVGTDAGVTVAAGVLTAGMWDDGLNYDFFSSYVAGKATLDGNPGFTQTELDAAHAEFATRSARSLVDVAIVIDTTGSMGDELSYLTSELGGIQTALAAAYPAADQRWALVVYRDTPDTDPGDEYVVRSFDFTTDTKAFASTLAAQSANFGGDYPESPQLGIEQLRQLTWRTDPSTAKLAFWVADAPHHTNKAADIKQAIVDAHTAGIHLYPVSASGTDDLLELTMRSAALITGGRYLFLTDDSGVGDPHKVPEIPCFYVTKLEDALFRAVSAELAGVYVEPAPSMIVRTSGAPTNGLCTTSDGTVVHIY